MRALVVVVPVAGLMGAVQAGLIIAVSHAKEQGLHWPSVIMAVASAALLAAGVLRHYLDIYLYRTVRGISFIFVGIDALGDAFSLVSVVFQPKLDTLGVIIYGTELVLWIGIFVCGAHYNFKPWVVARLRQGRVSQDVREHIPSAGSGSERREDAVVSGIALHELPSSTSVFRTPSGTIEALRQPSLSSVASRGSRTHVDYMSSRTT